MNRLTQGVIGVGLSVASFGVGGNSVEAGGNLPNNCTVYPVGEPVNIGAETALVNAGFGGVVANGRIDEGEQISVYQAQKKMKEVGVLAQDTKICGYAGEITKNAAKLMLTQSELSGSSQTDQSQSTSGNNATSSTETCDSVRLSTWVSDNILGSDGDLVLDNGVETRSVQNALLNEGLTIGRADGKLGTRTLGGFALFQQNEFGYVDCLLGSQTFNALNTENAALLQDTVASAQEFDPKNDCPTRTSCEMVEDLPTQTGMVKVNDGDRNTANGETLFTYALQSGRPGKETDTGLFILGPVELGANGNPWRTSTLGSTNGEPNLYRFRRHIPANGGWSGEGTHGSNAFGVGNGSSGCSRVKTAVMDILAQLPTNISLLIRGSKPA